MSLFPVLSIILNSPLQGQPHLQENIMHLNCQQKVLHVPVAQNWYAETSGGKIYLRTTLIYINSTN
jgi:hypothetical protein